VSPSADAGTGKAPWFLITKDMMARTSPNFLAAKWTAQGPEMVYKGAVLNATGKQTAHWAQVVAGGSRVWVLLENTRPV
jgi:hypothetical protein